MIFDSMIRSIHEVNNSKPPTAKFSVLLSSGIHSFVQQDLVSTHHLAGSQLVCAQSSCCMIAFVIRATDCSSAMTSAWIRGFVHNESLVMRLVTCVTIFTGPIAMREPKADEGPRKSIFSFQGPKDSDS